MVDRETPPGRSPNESLAGHGSETNEGILEELARPTNGPDRTDLTEFYSDETLEDDPTLTDRTEDSEMPIEEELTIHDAEDER